jgi:acetyl-CoA decarbonylase/synthase complex subunit gamma
VQFPLLDRLVLIPVELVQWSRYVLFLMIVLFLLAGTHRAGYSWELAVRLGTRAALFVLIAALGGAALAPLLLPWLPGRAFSIKGAILGGVLFGGLLVTGWLPLVGAANVVTAAAWFLLMPAIAAFLTMNFTGASTYTSLSGVRREMRFAVPAQIAAGSLGLGLWLVARFLH